jgi:iron complex outermembrane receptor protein
VGAYALVNAKLTWDFVRNAACVGQMFLALENLGNRIYEQKKGYPMPGINGLAGIKMQF